jgi:DNA-binding response OmpR family regulator
MSRILIVEDEAHLAQGLRFNLEAEGYAVEVVDRGEEALLRVMDRGESFDVVLLDVMLPGKSGFVVAREMREGQNYVPVLMLTARGRPEDVLEGFAAGVDDYLAKPFNLPILLARIASLLRRKNWLAANRTDVVPASSEAASPDSFEFAGKTFDFENLQLRAGSQVVRLTLMEAELLRYFTQNMDRPISRKAILENVWNLHEDTDTRAIDNFIVRLRRYIEEDPSQPRHLLTVRGFGYRFVPNPSQD